MLSLLPTLLFAIQAIFLYFERNLLIFNDFWVVAKIITFNLTAILIVYYFFPKRNLYIPQISKINQKLSQEKTSIYIFIGYLILFLIQVLIRGNIPAITGIIANEVSYSKWPVSPFSGFMSILYLLILGERISVWIKIKNQSENKINNLILIFMIIISLLMLRRDLLGLLIFGYCIKLYSVAIGSLKQLIAKGTLKKIFINSIGNVLFIFLFFIIMFAIIGLLRGQGTGINRAYWKIISLYISVPLANSLTLINSENSGYLSLFDFYIGGSSVGQSFLNALGIEPGRIPSQNYILPQFNVTSSLGYYYQVFGKELYVFAIALYSGFLAVMEIHWKKKEPILFSLILLLACASIFYHYFGTITITLIFPIILIIHKFTIRLL